MSEITLVFFGTNGWYTSKTGYTTCITIDTPDHFIILDAGEGFSKIPERYPVIDKPAFLFFSHFHLDHISGLHTLARCRFERGLSIYGPPGVQKLADFIGYPYTIPIHELPFPVTITELAEGRNDCGFPVTTAFLVHTQPVFGYRFNLGKIIAFCTDTGACDGILTLGKEADLLITECAYLPGQENPGWPHLNPEVAVRLAQEAGAKQLALVHFAADLYTSLEQRLSIRNNGPQFSDVIIGMDDMVIKR
ncbi:MAG TPA: ribonuclease Z [Methanospirillum sp.]|uniref:MBL fold metallo-hydrolase n=1 Tax=Methanospirillum sp. TaxID=45200 RepID=UPI002BF5970B|nr:ribonuclease Z [Methanospirillum sp.]HOJ97431.1 ribonuclease Z [Methanospirillum sp.]HPP78042.1 ribonuclease Z [Methanospirillum sp.]